jgi:formylglycine-generating enzyme required for sulfatase activity
MAYFLPTEDEWYKAAYYDLASGLFYNYATGSDAVPTAVSSGTAAGTAVYSSFAMPAEVWASGGLSPYGTMGQSGNVGEWNETPFLPSTRMIRGGSYHSNDISASHRTDAVPSLESSDIGFRVAALGVVPEPGSLGLLLLGLTGLLVRRKRATR